MIGSNCVAAEYIWVSGADTHHDIRSKIRTLPADKFANFDDRRFLVHDDRGVIDQIASLFPVWSFDGSSTEQALCCKGLGENTEIVIIPRRAWLHPHPIQHGGHTVRTFVVLCECFLPHTPLVPTPDNTRAIAVELFAKHCMAEPWFAMEQEYVVVDAATGGRPYKWPADAGKLPAPQGPYYCSNGEMAWGRHVAVAHYAACLAIGVRLSGMNAEVMPAQWEYQVGPCTGIEAADHAIAARWLLVRIAAMNGLGISFHSKPVAGDWNGSGMHTNYSTAAMRRPGGIRAIRDALELMKAQHASDIALYGDDNHLRLSGRHETSNMDTFSYGVGMRNVSCRIPVQAEMEGCGYLEDRRPSSSADPYLVTAVLFASSTGATTEALAARKQAKIAAFAAAKAARGSAAAAH